MTFMDPGINIVFRDIFLENYQDLCVYAFGYVRRKDIAEDIVQDVFSQFWDNRQKIDFTYPTRPLLFKYTKNKSLNYLKQKALRNIDLDGEVDAKIEKYLIDLLSTLSDDDVHFNYLKSEIEKCIEVLPEQCKRVFEMSRFSGMKNREIAEAMGISIKTVEKHISVALSKIRSHLSTQDLIYILFIIWVL